MVEEAQPAAGPRPAPDVSVVVVSYNTKAHLERCLTAVGRDAAEIVVADNCSTDGSAELVARSFPHVRLIPMGGNAGFGTAANRGIEATAGRYVVLLNADAWPLEHGLRRLVERAESDPRIGLAGPLLVDPVGNPRRSAVRHPPGALALALWLLLPRAVSAVYALVRRLSSRARGGGLRPGEFLMGAALLLRREAFSQVGGFDEAFFMFDEDVDLCHAMRRAGWRIELVGDACFVHVGGAATRADPEAMFRERLRSHLRFLAKHQGIRRAELARRLSVATLVARGRLGRDRSARAAAEWLGSAGAEELLRERRR